MTNWIARVDSVTWLLVVSLSLVSARGAAATDAEQAWAALAAGAHVALIRHANAPPGYGGDPPGFRMDDCKTQRNLDELGRQQPRRSARPSGSAAFAWIESWLRRSAAAWTPRS